MKRNKLFGIFNIVDILLILIVIIVGIVGGRMLLGGRGAAESGADTKTYSYVVMGEEVVAETANFPVVGGNAYESSTSTYLGTVKDVKTEPFTETMFNRTTGKYEKVPVDGYSNIYVTIEGNGTETEKDITVEGTTVKVGMELNVKGKGCDKVNYKLRDWVFSRQRYWGEPIPMVKCEKCGWQPLPESSLPLTLPDITDFEPGPDGESPLARHTDWVKTTCPCCGGPATRETDTMPQWAGSSWYFLRYMDPHCKDALASKEALEYWSPVDWYNGGMEHTTLHLLYSRFWHKFLYDIGVVPTKEPYQKRTSHGMILGLNPHAFENQPDAERKRLLAEYGDEKGARKALVEKYGEMAEHPIVKMSKSLGNVVNPDDVVNEYGADTLRLYEMFIGDFEKAAPWNTSSIKGCKRFLDKIWLMSEKLVPGEGVRPELEAVANRTIKKVGEDIDALKANTAIAQLMIYVNALSDQGGATKAEYELLLQLLNPFAPHMTEELWQQLGHTEQLAYHAWPTYDEAKCVEQTIEIAVQVNGKVKARIKVPAAIENADAIAAAKAEPAVAEAIAGKTIAKEIYVKGKLVNIAVKG